MYVCMSLFVHVSTFVCLYVCVYVCMYKILYGCVQVCMLVCMCVYLCRHAYTCMFCSTMSNVFKALMYKFDMYMYMQNLNLFHRLSHNCLPRYV